MTKTNETVVCIRSVSHLGVMVTIAYVLMAIRRDSTFSYAKRPYVLQLPSVTRIVPCNSIAFSPIAVAVRRRVFFELEFFAICVCALRRWRLRVYCTVSKLERLL